MTPEDILQAVLEDEELQGYLQQGQWDDLAAALSYTVPTHREVGIGTIYEVLGATSAAAMLDAIYSSPILKYAGALLERGKLDISSNAVAQAIALLVSDDVITQQEADNLLALGIKVKQPTQPELQVALINDDGSLKI